MPFPTQPQRAFTEATILELKPDQVGCYGLFTIHGCVYVGCGALRERLLAHARGDDLCILRNRPIYYLTMTSDEPESDARRLIAELRPVCNKDAALINASA